MVPNPPGGIQPPQARHRELRWVIATMLVVAIVGAGTAAVVLARAKNRPQARPPDYAAIEAAARDGTVALLSFGFDEADPGLDKARSLLTGDALEKYSSLTETLLPAAQQFTSLKVVVPAVGVTVADSSSAAVLVFVEQTTTMGNGEPHFSRDSMREHLVEMGGRWLIDQFALPSF